MATLLEFSTLKVTILLNIVNGTDPFNDVNYDYYDVNSFSFIFIIIFVNCCKIYMEQNQRELQKMQGKKKMHK